MSCVCPVDLKHCPDDVCNGAGRCCRNGESTLERCLRCMKIFDPQCEGDGTYCEACDPQWQDVTDEVLA